MAFRWKFWERRYDSLDLFRELYPGWQNWSNKPITLHTAMQVSAAFACGRVIAEGIAMLPWKIFQESGRIREPARDHPLYDRLATQPNPMQTAFEFQETVGLHLAFCFNAYVWTPRVTGVYELYPIEPSWVTVERKWPSAPTYMVRPGDGREFPLPADQVWHIRGPSWSGFRGLEYLGIARQALGLAMALEEGQAKLQAEGVMMPGYLSVEGKMTEEQYKQLRKYLDTEHAGTHNRGRAGIIDQNAKWVATSMSNSDAQLIEQRKFAVEEVCRGMRVLPIMVGHADKAATYASAEQMFLAHSQYTLGPWARRLEQSADARLLTREERSQGFYTNLNEKALLRMTAKDQMEFLARGVLSGIYTRNEARGKLDENPIEGLDEPLAPANTFTGNPPAPNADKPDPPADDPE